MLLAGGLLAQQKKQPEIDLQAAIRTETVDGDLKAAIKQYGDIVAKYKNDRAVTAMALLHMAECYQKMGDAESHKIYERVVREYADQKEAVATARARLGSAAEKGAGIVARQVWVGPKVSTEGTVSPDGRYVSFPDWSANELGLHDLLTGNDRRLTAKDGSQKSFEYAEESAISRDGKQVAFAWFNGERYDLRVTELTGSPAAKPRILLTNAEVAWIAPYDWSPDGKWIAVQLQRKDRTAQLGLVSVLDGALRVLRSVDWSGSSNLLFSPDGKYLAYDLPASDGSDQRDIFLMATNASKEIPLLVQPADETVLAWTPDGKHLLFASNRGGATGLWAISLNDGKPQDSPLLIKPDIGHASRGLGVTRSGTLYLGVGVGGQDVYIAAVDFQTGKTLSAPAKPIQQFVGANRQPSFSPDGKYMAYQSIRGRSSMVLAIRSLETGQVRELRPDLS
jgi:Tol biopolymer transport system component